jgi:hypothetical protein
LTKKAYKVKFIPYGIARFSELRQGDYLYVDKTRLLYELVRHKISYFLSRPRRFGKTLTVSSLKAILEGRRELFKGLWIDSSDYDWRPYPVIHQSLASLGASNPEKLEEILLNLVKNIAGIEKITDSPPKGENYNLVFPNLEVKASLAPLLLSLETPMEDQLLMKRQTMNVKACLFKRDASGFQAAFSSFIANFPYQIQQTKEFFYQALFISAMALADQYFESELSVGGGRIDLHLQEPQGDDYVIEIKYREANENLENKTREAFV